MTYHQDRFFKKYNYVLEDQIRTDVVNFCLSINSNLSSTGIKKFTVVLGDETSADVTIIDDNNRTYTLIDSIDTIYGIVKIFHSAIEGVGYSDIPIIFVIGNEKFKDVVKSFKDCIKKYIPEGYNIGTHSGNTYLIFTNEFTGQLWNIHRDAFNYKMHLNLTDCDQEFVWYADETEYRETLSKDTLYLFDVKTPHTIFVNGYGEDNFRLHLVVDLSNQ